MTSSESGNETERGPGEGFAYRGRIPSSKSILNRLHVIGSFASDDFVISGDDSSADDVVKMRTGLRSLLSGKEVDCGAAGTTLRFLALRASRIPGFHRFTGSRRLFERPQKELLRLLQSLGCRVSLGPTSLEIEATGWQPENGRLKIDRSVSSQFASALVLNSWNLERDLRVEFEGERVSEGYFAMTLELVRAAGMDVSVESRPDSILISAAQSVSSKEMKAEIDLSSAFAVAALAVAYGGEARFEDWPLESLQPDAEFVAILRSMGCSIEVTTSANGQGELVVRRNRTMALAPIEWSLANCPDLFPVLSVLCAFAKGQSRLFGAPHLIHKESDRVTKTAELLQLLGGSSELIEGGLLIRGKAPSPSELDQLGEVQFDPNEDHRLAFAAATARAFGVRVSILHPDVVEKSFPEFWKVASGMASRGMR